MAKFSQRHYEKIADLLREVERNRAVPEFSMGSAAFSHLCSRFVEMFKWDNPKFDGSKFMSRVLREPDK